MNNHTFHGSATVGEKGQIVIPAEARAALQIEKGEKLLVFGVGEKGLFITKPSQLEIYAQKLTEKLSNLHDLIEDKP